MKGLEDKGAVICDFESYSADLAGASFGSLHSTA